MEISALWAVFPLLAMTDVTDSGILTPDSDVLFTGSREGHFHVRTPAPAPLLWQYVGVAAGNGYFVFALKD